MMFKEKYQKVAPEHRLLKKKIIFIMPHLPTVDFQRKYFVNQLKENNFILEYWDVGPILGYDMKFISDLTDVNYTKIICLKELKLRLKYENHADAVFVLQLTRNLQSLSIYSLFRLYNKRTVFFGRGYLPCVSQPKTIGYYLNKVYRGGKNLSSIIYATIFRFLPVIKKYDLVFAAGTLAERLHLNDAIKISKIHHFDVDHSTDKNVENNFIADCCVFIDDFMPFHPDFSLGSSDTINADNYYNSLNNFFDTVEKKLGKTIIIAAHPKATYKNNPFNKRTIVFGDTNSLVKNSVFVFTHASTAIAYAVIYEKPLCLIFSDEIKSVHFDIYNLMIMTSKILDCPILNFEKNSSFDLADCTVDKKKYEDYYVEFLSNEANTRLSSEIVIDEINNLFRTG